MPIWPLSGSHPHWSVASLWSICLSSRVQMPFSSQRKQKQFGCCKGGKSAALCSQSSLVLQEAVNFVQYLYCSRSPFPFLQVNDEYMQIFYSEKKERKKSGPKQTHIDRNCWTHKRSMILVALNWFNPKPKQKGKKKNNNPNHCTA